MSKVKEKKITTSKAGASVNVGASSSFKAYGNPLPYIAPWVVALTMLGLAIAIRLGLSRDVYSWYWSLLTAAMYSGLAAVAYLGTRARGQVTHWLATLGIGGAGTWGWYVAGVDHLTWRPLALYALGMVPVCGGSMILSAMRDGSEPHEGMTDKLRNTLDQVRNANRIHVEGGRVIVEGEMLPGATVDDLDTKALGSGIGAPPGGIAKLPLKPGQSSAGFRLAIDPAGGAVEPGVWRGPSRTKTGTLADPAVVGFRSGGVLLEVPFCGNPATGQQNSHIMVVGVPGAGKSEGVRTYLVEGMNRHAPGLPSVSEFEYWYGDGRKADQQPTWVLTGAARVARTNKEIVRMLRDLREEIPERARALGEAGYDQWLPGCAQIVGFRFRVVVLDEIASVAQDIARLLTDLGETARSVGIKLVLMLQRASGTRFPTDARAVIAARWCFGVAGDEDAEMALPDEVLEMGANPQAWGDREAGRCYFVASGVDRELWAQPARTFAPDKNLMIRWAEYLVKRNREPVASLAPAASPAGHGLAPAPSAERAPARRTRRDMDTYVEEGELLDDSDEGGIDYTHDFLEVDGNQDIETGEEDDEVTERDMAEVAEVLAELDGDDEGPIVDEDEQEVMIPADLADEVRRADGLAPGPETSGGFRFGLQPKVSPDQARDLLRKHLEGLRDSGRQQFTAEDLDVVLEATGFGASWLRKWLNAWSQRPGEIFRRVTPNGRYEFVDAPRPRVAALGTGDRA